MVGGASALVALAWLVSAFDTEGTGVSSSGSSGPFVVIPLLLLLAIAGVTWFLLARDTQPDADPVPYVECSTCGRSILREWRLCPYCGSRISQSSAIESALSPRRDPASREG